MQRAKVCMRSVIVSGESHLRLVKVKEPQPEITDHEAAYLDNTGTIYRCPQKCWLTSVMSRLVNANYVRVSFIDSVQAKPMFCPERTGGSCWSAACWRYARWSATRRLSWWWSQPWSSTPSTTTSPWGRNWSFSACRPPSSITTITMPTTTSGRLTSQHNLFLDDWCDAQAICFSVQQVDADGKCWSTTAMEYFQPGVWDYVPMKQHLHRAVREAFYETLFYFLPSLPADDNLPAPAASSLLSEVAVETSRQPRFVRPLWTQRHGVRELQTCFR